MEHAQKMRVPEPQRNEIPFMGGRPERDTAIGQEDILNLIIALNTAATLAEFFDLV